MKQIDGLNMAQVETVKAEHPGLYDGLARLVMAGQSRRQIMAEVVPMADKTFAAKYPFSKQRARQEALCYLEMVEATIDYLMARL